MDSAGGAVVQCACPKGQNMEKGKDVRVLNGIGLPIHYM